MASYHVRQREPLLDRQTREALERRGRELAGVAVLVLAVAGALTLATYNPDDPAWMGAADAEARNALGRIGAALAAPMFIIAGFGSWALVVILAGWGVRLVTHQSPERALGRVIFAPIAVALASIYASTLLPPAQWPHSFGLGGLFGDTILGAMLQAFPGETGFGLKLLSVLLALSLLALGLFVLGVTLRETFAFGRFLKYGLAATWWAMLAIGGAAAVMAWRGWGAGRRALAARRAARREAAAHAQWHADDPVLTEEYVPYPDATAAVRRPVPVLRAGAEPPARSTGTGHWRTDLAPPPGAGHARPHGYPAPTEPAVSAHSPERTAAAARPAPQEEPQPGGLGSLLGLVPGLGRRPLAQPELVEPEPIVPAGVDVAPEDDRIRARISDAIRARRRQTPVLTIDRSEPPLRRPQTGPAPRPAASTFAPASPRATPPQHVPTLSYPVETAFDAYAEPAFDTSYDADDEVAYRAHHDAPETAPEIPAAPPAAPGLFQRRRVLTPAPRRAPAPSARAMAEAQPALRFEDPAPDYELPPLSLLSNPANIERQVLSDEALEENARMLENVLDDYGVRGEIVSVRPGPVVTMYELEPAPGLKASRVIGLADDIARSMSALSARVSTVPGRSVIGIELPNARREKVLLREIFSARSFDDAQTRLPLALGKDIGGDPIIANLAKMPHLLIAGTTGSGKSVAINTMILSLLYRLRPEECRLIMIDPKMLELSVYDGIPHLLSPVVTDPKKAVVALKWVVGEMEDRYRKMSKMGVRNIEGYNGRVREALERGEMFKRTVQTGFDDETGDPVFDTEEFEPVALPYIVVIVDEMADLMMVAGKEIEACIQRLAQMARASGIHLIMATQRPSVDVITGTIKANFPTRISFQVTSKIDSRTILGEMGAEQLLGMGDMLYMAGGGRITRIHGPFVSDEEVEEVVTHLKSFGPPSYIGGVVDGPDEEKEADIDAVLGLGSGDGGDDALYDQAVAIVARDRKCSTSYIQRKLGIGYNKAARLVEQMEDQGVVTPANHVGKREILVEER